MTDLNEALDKAKESGGPTSAPQSIPSTPTPGLITTSEAIEVKKEKLDAILAKLDRFEEMQEKIIRLESAASKAELAKYDAKNQKHSKVVNLLMIDGKVITHWDNLIKDTVEKNPASGAWREEQIINVHYEDGTNEEMAYVVFSRRYVFLPAEVKGEIKRGEDTILEVETLIDKKQYNINVKFVN